MAKRKRTSDSSSGDGSHKRTKKEMPKRKAKAMTITTNNDNPPQASLLGIPGELRNQIFRLSLKQPDEILFKRDTAPEEPALLRCCRTIRQEARSIFFEENTFFVMVFNCRIATQHWLWRADGIPCDQVSVLTFGTPSWSALKEWFRAWDEGDVKGYPENESAPGSAHGKCSKAFRLVREMGSTSWKKKEAALEVFRSAVDGLRRHAIFDD